jgi:uncharacterized protein
MSGCRIEIKAVPNAPKSEVVGWLGESLKVKVHAPPVEGKANAALCTFLAEMLGVQKRMICVIRGDSSRGKILEITGHSKEEILARLPPKKSENNPR